MAYDTFSSNIVELGKKIHLLQTDIGDHRKGHRVLVAQAEECQTFVAKMYDFAQKNPTTVTQAQFDTLSRSNADLDQAIIYIRERRISFWEKLLEFFRGASKFIVDILPLLRVLRVLVQPKTPNLLGSLVTALAALGDSKPKHQLPSGRAKR